MSFSSPAYSRSFRPELERLEERCVLSTAQYVTGLYSDLLHRSPSRAEVRQQVAALDAGENTAQFALGLIHSAEYSRDQVRADYQALLGRLPTPAELRRGLAQLKARLGPQHLEAQLLASDEYYSKHGGTVASWLGGVFQDVLGRQPSPAEIGSWSSRLQTGASRESVAFNIVFSREAHSRAVRAGYEQLLKHDPNRAHLASWRADLDRGLPVAQFLAALAGSPAYLRRVAPTGLDVRVAAPVGFFLIDNSAFGPDLLFPDITFDPGVIDFGGFGDFSGFDGGDGGDGGDCGC
jgi:hypothetical protein